MNYQITSDNTKISPSMEALARDKFLRIENKIKDYDDATKSARIVLNTAPDGMFLVKAELVVNGKNYFSNETDFSLEGALIKTVEEVFQMLEKEKTRKEKQLKNPTDVIDNTIEETREEL
jgi:ribosome-associated translation inhibitor RaiA